MREFFHKLLSLTILVTFAYVVFTEVTHRNKKATILPTVEQGETARMFTALGGAGGSKPVIMFVTSWCPVCKALEKELAARGIPFLLADIENDRSALLFYEKVAAGRTRGIPVTVVGTKAIMGFKPELIIEELESVPAMAPAPVLPAQGV